MAGSGFEWDSGNRSKCQKHGVSIVEIEEIFERPLLTIPDTSHSQSEERLWGIGKTKLGRAVFLVFTLRRHGQTRLIRPISARYMHEAEVRSYEKENPDLQD